MVVAIIVIVVLAVVFVAAVAARRDRAQAIGRLSRETRRGDRSRAAIEQLERGEGRATTGREVERSAVLQRRGDEVLPVPAKAAPPAPAYLDPEAIGVTRRQFFNRSIVAMMGLGLSGFGAAAIAFLWPVLKGGFGAKIRTRKVDDILAEIRDGKTPVYVPEGRFYLSAYPKDAVGKAKQIYAPPVVSGMEAGIVALYQKCVHLGCRVPWCVSSQWFECPCHGSKYNRVGEKKGGPAPRGLDRFGVSVDGGVVVVDTGQLFQGPAIGTNTTGQEAEGPHCA